MRVTASKRRPRECDSRREGQRRAASGTQRRDSKRLQEAEVAATESGLAAAAWEAVCTLCAAPAESIVSSSTNVLSGGKKACPDTPNDRQTAPTPLCLSFSREMVRTLTPSRVQVDQST